MWNTLSFLRKTLDKYSKRVYNVEVFKMSNEKIRLFKMKGACCTYIISYPAVQKKRTAKSKQ
jgi:hypothetical protein